MKRLFFLSTSVILLLTHLEAGAVPVLTNGDFSGGLTGWTTQNSGDGTDTSVIWTIEDPSGSDQLTNNGSSGGPASRVVYQDFVVPATGAGSASFSFDYYANNDTPLTSDSFTTFTNNPFGGDNGTRIDILSPADDVFTGAVLFSFFAPTDGAPVGLPTALVSNTYADAAALASFLDSQAGNTLRLRIGNREEDFPWDTGFDNINLDIVAAEPSEPPKPVPTMSIWSIGILSGMIGLLGMYHRRRK